MDSVLLTLVIMFIPIPSSHHHCIACGDPLHNACSFQLRFSQTSEGDAYTCIQLGAQHQGYSQQAHGGVISTLLDAAMTHRLFAEQIHGMTAELKVRFIAPVPLMTDLHLCARLDLVKRGVYVLSSELSADFSQQRQVYARAQAKFLVPGSAALK